MNPDATPSNRATAPGVVLSDTGVPDTPFVFLCCQVGAERALKAELAHSRPDWRIAFSRPGFLTFKTPLDNLLQANSGVLQADLGPMPIFARAWGASLGKVTGQSAADLAAAAWQKIGDWPWDRLHVWQRDERPTGDHGFEPSATPLAETALAAIRAAAPAGLDPVRLMSAAEHGQLVLDCAIVEPGEWWLGAHRVSDPVGAWPGGTPTIALPPDAVSRAYLKMAEALAWSQLPIEPGQQWAELGCAPGGASQALLERGLNVLGIDPAMVDERLLAEPRFTHLQMRSADPPRKLFRDVTWLSADLNVAPQYTLDAVEGIVVNARTDIRGLILTLKLLDWELAAEIPAYLERVRSWGFGSVRARQLAFNRREICVAAERESGRRPAARRKTAPQRRLQSRLTPRRRRLD